METLEVHTSQQLFSDEDDDLEYTDQTWGRLLPIKRSFKPFELNGEEIKFGRDDDCEYSFCDVEKDTSKLLAYSKIHFILLREELSTGKHTFLKDTSSNGTFINGTKVGKNMKQVLNNNDEISLVAEKNKAFIYIDLDSTGTGHYPEEIESNYTVSKLLGRGACGEVKIVFDKYNDCQAHAMKIIPKKKFSICGSLVKDSSNQVQNEVKIMKNLHHPCIVKVENVVDTDDYLFIILELVKGGELFDRIVNCKKLKESTAKLLFYQIVLAVKYLHSEGITHRDLKVENILLVTDEDETLIKVTDFGLSKFVNAATVMQTLCGTPTYLAPEVILSEGKGSYTNAIDCWSLGVILFVCLGGYPPFSDDYPGNLTLTQQIKSGSYNFPAKKWKDVSKEGIDLIKKFLTVSPDERITLEQALEHPWLQDDQMKKKASVLMNDSVQQLPPMAKIVTKRALEDQEVLLEDKRLKAGETK